MAISSYSATLKSKPNAGQGTLTKMADIKDFPDLIGDPNLLETTTLTDNAQTFIAGIRQMDMLQFTINWDKTDCNAIKTAEGTLTDYELSFSDGVKFTWTGTHTLGVPGKGVDEVLEATINIVPSTVITIAFS